MKLVSVSLLSCLATMSTANIKTKEKVNTELMDWMIDNRHDEDKKTGYFEMYYKSKFNTFAHPAREKMFQKTLETIKKNRKNELAELQTVIDLGNAMKEDTYELVQQGRESTTGVIQKHGKKLSGAALGYATNYAVAASVVSATVKQGVLQGGRRGAIITVQTSGLAASQGAHAALNGVKFAGKLGAVGPGISAAIGQAAGEYLGKQTGITNRYVQHGFAFGGAVAGGAAAGAIAGPAGALGGAALGAASFAMGETITALANSKLGFSGPNDNWCYISTGKNRGNDICFGTYVKSDTWYARTYWKEWKKDRCSEFVMSAGQGRREAFQVVVWDRNWNDLATIKEVYFRDTIWVHRGKVIHGKGERWGNGAGKVVVY